MRRAMHTCAQIIGSTKSAVAHLDCTLALSTSSQLQPMKPIPYSVNKAMAQRSPNRWGKDCKMHWNTASGPYESYCATCEPDGCRAP